MSRFLPRRLLACAFLVLLPLLTVVPAYARSVTLPQAATAPAPARGLPGPDTIPDMLLWLDAADPDADGDPTNDPADGSALTTWQDKSGLGNHASVLTGQSAGTFRSGGGEPINGNPVVRFTRTNEFSGSVYTVPGVDIRAITHEDVTLFTVYRPKSIPNPYHGIWGNDDGAWDRFFLPYHFSFGDGIDDGLISLGPMQQGQVVPDAAQINIVRLLTAIYNGDLGAVPPLGGPTNSGPVNGSAVYFDGRLVTRFTDSSYASAAQTSFALGWDGDDGTFDGDIAEVIVYGRALDACELRDVNRYLSDKYAATFVDPPAPGGVRDPVLCNLRLWLKATGSVRHNDGDVSHWTDESGLGADVVQSDPAQQPLYQLDRVNFNPALSFTGGATGDILSGTLPSLTPDQPYTLFAIFNPANGVPDNLFGIGTANGSHTSIGYHPNLGGSRLHFHWSDNLAIPGLLEGWQVATFRYTAQPATVNRFLFFNGQQGASDDTTLSLPATSALQIGGFPENIVPNYYTGELSEFIFYDSALSPTEQAQVESYLAVKHGITLGTPAAPISYLDSAATTIWDGPANATYHHDIGGIGRDDASALDQRVTRSINSDALVTIDNGGAFSADQSFLLWGNNNLTTTLIITAGQHLHMGRVWTVAEAGTVGTVSLGIPSSTGVDSLFVDSDTDFSDATVIALTDDGLGNLTASVDFTDGQFFTFGEAQPPTAVTVGALGSHATPPVLPWLLAGLGLVALALLTRWRRG